MVGMQKLLPGRAVPCAPGCHAASHVQRRQPRPFSAPSRRQLHTTAPRCGSSRHSGRSAPVVCSAAVTEQVQAQPKTKSDEVLDALRQIIDPDFNQNIVECGFVKDLTVNEETGAVAFKVELTTPACPIKDEFQRQSESYVKALPWVNSVAVTMTSQPARPAPGGGEVDGRPFGLAKVKHIIAVSSCKGGVGKSTVSVNLAFTLAQMGAKVGLFDADLYGPSLPCMVSPEVRIMAMEPETKALSPVEYRGVKIVSLGFAAQGAAIMRGPMAAGLIQQLMLSAVWGELDYLLVDFPPGTGDIQLTLCQTAAFTASVVVTTPQKLAFVDVAKGIRMFAKLAVPCVAVVENMSFFEADGKRHFPFGHGSGDRIAADFGLRNLFKFPIVPDLSAAGDGGEPLVVSDPACSTSAVFMELGASVVREVAKLSSSSRSGCEYDAQGNAIVVRIAGGSSGEAADEFRLHPAVVRRNDTSAASINEWTGARMIRDEDIPDDIRPASITTLGNYAVQISWEDGFNQVAPFELLDGLRYMALEPSSSSGSS